MGSEDKEGAHGLMEPNQRAGGVQIGVQELSQIMFDLVDNLRRSTSLTDVNLAAGVAFNALLGLEVDAAGVGRSGTELIELLAHGADELGQVLNLPL